MILYGFYKSIFFPLIYIISTHIDKDPVHHHILFCAADNLEHDKYHDCKQTYYLIRKLSDELCSKHQLSVMNPGRERGKSYKEWQADRDGTSHKTEMRKNINTAIWHSPNYGKFLMLMKAKGYEIKGEDFGEGTAKYIAFRPLDKEQTARKDSHSL